MRLINPQPIETLPEDDTHVVYIRIAYHVGNEAHYAVAQHSVQKVRRFMGAMYHGIDAWSYEATPEQGKEGGL